MARTFNDSLEEELESVFLNTDEFAVTVTLKRSVHSTPNVPAIVASKSNETTAVEDIGTDAELREYRIRSTAYRFNGSVVIPRGGDFITETLRTGVTIVCEVLPPSQSKPSYEPDANGSLLLVHTKVVKRDA